MKNYASQRSSAAKWMYERRDNPEKFWRWGVLTRHNSDEESLKLEVLTAHLIFNDLVRDGLLVPIIAPDGHEAYAIHTGRDQDWLMVMKPWRYWFKRNILQLFLWVIGTVVGGVIGLCLGLWWDKILGK